MNLQVFKARTMAEALGEVKRVMGTDAVILHTRTYKVRYWLGLRWREIVEITAGRGLQVRPGAKHKSPVFKTIAPPPPEPVNPVANGKMILDSNVAGNAMMVGINNEVATLKTMISELAHQVRREKKPTVPDELFDAYTQLISNQVCDDLATKIVLSLHQQLRPEHLANAQFVQEKLAEHLETLLPTAGPLTRTKTTSPNVIALIGPTGVGKTTTIAKLAAKLSFDQHHRVGLITLDTYRIAAVEQLKKYADIIGAPLKIVISPDDLREAVRSMNECDFVLVDTAGRSPNDTMKLNELKQFLSGVEPDEVHLVLSAAASQECMELALDRFGSVRADKIIFTKLDEAAHAGVVLNIVHKVGKSVSYITTGQDVPKHIEIGSGGRLAQLILGSAL